MSDPLPSADVMAIEKVTRSDRRTELAQVEFKPGLQMFQPTNGRELMDMANLMSSADKMVKDIFRGPQNQGNCMGLIALCAPYGINPIQASWKVYQTKPDAPMAYEAQLVVAMVNASGVLEDGFDYRLEGAGPTRKVFVTGRLRGGADKVLETPEIGQIKVKNSPLWTSDPDQQLCYYGARAWVRRHKPEMLLGIYTTDELPPGPDHARDVTPRAAPPRGGVIYREDPAQVSAPDTIFEHDADGVVIDAPTPERIEAEPD